MEKMRINTKKITILMFLLIIFIYPILSLKTARVKVSEIENRSLSAFPKIQKLSLFKQNFYTDIDAYLSDHLFGRGFWFKEYSRFSLNVLKKDTLQNVIVGKDGMLLRYYEREDLNSEKDHVKAEVEASAKVINNLGTYLNSKGKTFYFVGVPYHSTNFEAKYPIKYYNRSDKRQFKENLLFSSILPSVGKIDLNEVFARYGNDRYDFYYKTDHHWNIKGSYAAYTEILNKIRDSHPEIRPPYKMDELNVRLISNKFEGSFGRELNYVYKTDDKAEIYEPKEGLPQFTRYVNGEIDNNVIKICSNYGVFMGGDIGEMLIQTNRANLPNILIVGNSYTNSLEYLLFPHFNETRSLDYRHFDKMGLQQYIDTHDVDVVLYVMDDSFYDDYITMKGMAGDYGN